MAVAVALKADPSSLPTGGRAPGADDVVAERVNADDDGGAGPSGSGVRNP